MRTHAQLVLETKASETFQQRTAQRKGKRAAIKKIYQLFKDYFVHSDEKWAAWLLLIGALVCAGALIGLTAAFAWWSTGFWALLAAKTALTPFLVSLGQFALLLVGYVVASSLQNFFTGTLSLRWRNWLTKKTMNELLHSENNYVDLRRVPSNIDNVPQRVQEDIKNLVELTLNMGVNLFNSIVSLSVFTASLWVIGGSLAIGLNIVIPGYLVWVALIVALASTALTYAIGKPLPKKTKKNEQAEADLRKDLVVLDQEAESIAIEHAEGYHKASLEQKMENVTNTATQKLDTQTKVTAFQSLYSQISSILPVIFAAPLYFSGAIQLGQLMQIGICFSQVSQALSVFVTSYESIASCKTSAERLGRLQSAFEKDGLPVANEKSIRRKVRNKDLINIKNLNIMQPTGSTNYILRDLNLKFQPGEHVLIQGPSGVGKSTIFRAISGTWKYGNGQISVPADAETSVYFLPQRPILPHNTLEAVLAYPQPATTYRSTEYAKALQNVGGMDDFIPILKQTRDWAYLSAGQQQRISFARVLLKKPKWLFLDEATSALDEESEDHVYRTVQNVLNNTTIVSIGHRNTIRKFHSKVIFFDVNKEKEAKLTSSQGNTMASRGRSLSAS